MAKTEKFEKPDVVPGRAHVLFPKLDDDEPDNFFCVNCKKTEGLDVDDCEAEGM